VALRQRRLTTDSRYAILRELSVSPGDKRYSPDM
jgi:hypothetical protein